LHSEAISHTRGLGAFFLCLITFWGLEMDMGNHYLFMASTVSPGEPVGFSFSSRFIAIEELGGHIDGGSDEGLVRSGDDDRETGN